ncbi:MAG TPA: hypothetical protein VGH44_04060 [Candidatus Saccharimonadia bacterium]|jgi:hypothetical protein
MSSSTGKGIKPPVLWAWIAGVNGLGAIIAAVFGVVSLIDPGFPGGSVNTLVHLYAGTYAVRAIPIAIVLIVLLIRSRSVSVLVPVLLIAGLAQAGDAVLGVIYGQFAMLAGGGAYAVIHLSTAAWLWKRGSVR